MATTALLVTEHPTFAGMRAADRSWGTPRSHSTWWSRPAPAGWSLADLAAGYPSLSMAEILDGLSFYEDHRDEIDRLIQANRIPRPRRRMADEFASLYGRF